MAPVVIANGFALFPLPIRMAREYYAGRGYDVRGVPFRLSNSRSTVTYARRIAETVEDASRENGGVPVNLIGFSMGGVAGLYAVKRLGLAPRIASFVALAAPFKGTILARLGPPSILFSATGRELAPHSRFLAELHADPLPPGPRYVSIGGEKDLLCPAPTTRLEGADNRVGPFGHKDFLIDPEVHALIETCLT